MKIESIGIRHAPLSNRIVLARFGKDPHVALESRDAMDDFLKAIISYAFDGQMPVPGKAMEIKFGGGDEQFSMTVKRLETQP
ncbi:hypothetical protein [Rhizobium sp.]|uniref:hypothetical protein n=1 Tax=Rhizobium sp. TaxID=391 RepID=UPI0028ACF134